jgi:hypothetical protein
MRRYILFFVLCLIFFILPLQVFIIGDSEGIGVQGAVYRYQWTGYGTFFFPVTQEVVFVLNGTYSGRTALSVILWVAGTVLLACTAVFSFCHVDDATKNYYRQVMYGLIIACVIYLGSCIAQYGFLFHGPGGLSFPLGIFLIIGWIAIIRVYQKFPGKPPESE